MLPGSHARFGGPPVKADMGTERYPACFRRCVALRKPSAHAISKQAIGELFTLISSREFRQYALGSGRSDETELA